MSRSGYCHAWSAVRNQEWTERTRNPIVYHMGVSRAEELAHSAFSLDSSPPGEQIIHKGLIKLGKSKLGKLNDPASHSDISRPHSASTST